jgi:hypothetical protein
MSGTLRPVMDWSSNWSRRSATGFGSTAGIGYGHPTTSTKNEASRSARLDVTAWVPHDNSASPTVESTPYPGPDPCWEFLRPSAALAQKHLRQLRVG